MTRRSELNRWLTLGLFALSACGDGKGDASSPPDGGPAPTLDGGDGQGDGEDASAADDASVRDAQALPDAAGEPDAGGPDVPTWFEDKEPLTLALSGALGDAFAAAFAGMPDGIFPPDRKKDPFDGTFAVGEREAESVVLSVRGNSSLQECPFPKLKLAYASRIDDATHVFVGTKKLKIGTHCGEEEATNGTIGRLRHERAAFREEVAYQLARALGITIMQTRPAIVTYTDTSSEPAFASPLTRKAFLLEHVDELARRLGATALTDPVDCGEDASLLPDGRAVLRVKLFHALIGNWDYQVGPPESHGCGPLSNTEVLVHPEGHLTLVPADFDLSALVVGEVRNPEDNQLEPITAENALVSARTYLAGAVAGESPEAVSALKAELSPKQATLKAVVQASHMDDEGKRMALLLIDGFFSALAE